MKNINLKYFSLFVFLVLIMDAGNLSAQADTSVVRESEPETILRSNRAKVSAEELVQDSIPQERIIPGKAALYSAILPGLGQVYNHKVWKVPIVYAALGSAIYGIWWNNDQANIYLNAFYEQTDPTIENPAFQGIYDESQLINLYYQHRRWKDLSMILGGLAYGLQVLDAYVDAHLFYYDINDNLSLQWEPKMFNTSFNSMPAAGVGFTFTIK